MKLGKVLASRITPELGADAEPPLAHDSSTNTVDSTLPLAPRSGRRMTTRALAVNTGSSSLRATLYRLDAPERAEITATAERIGLLGGSLRISDANGATG